MKPIGLLTLAGITAVTFGASSHASGTAVVLSPFSYEHEIGPLAGIGLPGRWPGVAQVLEENNYEIIFPEVETLDGFRKAIERAADNVSSDEPLLILADGLFIPDRPHGWMFFGPGDEIFDSELSERAISIDDIASISDDADGPVVLLVSTETAREAIAEDLMGEGDTESKLTYIMMDPQSVPGFLSEGLLREGMPMSAMPSLLPKDGSHSGAAASDKSMSGPVKPELLSTVAYDFGIWSAFSTIGTVEALDRYIEAQPDGAHVSEARIQRHVLEFNHTANAEEAEAGLQLTQEQRFVIQDNLFYLGFFAGEVSDNFSEETRAAIRDWQLWSRVPVTGYLDADQLAMMRQQVESEEEQERQIELDEERLEREYWMATGQRGSEQELNAYLDRYPAGIFSDIAYKRLEKLNAAIRAHKRGTSQVVISQTKATSAAPDESKRPASRAAATRAKTNSTTAVASTQNDDDEKPTFFQKIFDQTGRYDPPKPDTTVTRTEVQNPSLKEASGQTAAPQPETRPAKTTSRSEPAEKKTFGGLSSLKTMIKDKLNVGKDKINDTPDAATKRPTGRETIQKNFQVLNKPPTQSTTKTRAPDTR